METPEEWVEAFRSEDKKKFYYIVGVRVRTDRNFNQVFHCDAIVPYDTNHIKDAKLAKNMVENKLAPTEVLEAIDAVGLSTMNNTLNAYFMRIRANPDITVHKFVSETLLESEWIEEFVETASISEHTRNILKESQIRI